MACPACGEDTTGAVLCGPCAAAIDDLLEDLSEGDS